MYVIGQKTTAEMSRANQHAAHQRIRRLEGGVIHEKEAGDRREDRQSAEHKGINHRGAARRQPVASRRQCAHEHRADQGNRIRFEDVRRHARAVADVVAHVIRDGRRIPRIIFIQIRFHLAHEVRAHVGGLRVNAAAETRKDRNERSPERNAHEAGQRLLGLEPP